MASWYAQPSPVCLPVAVSVSVSGIRNLDMRVLRSLACLSLPPSTSLLPLENYHVISTSYDGVLTFVRLLRGRDSNPRLEVMSLPRYHSSTPLCKCIDFLLAAQPRSR